MKTTRFLTFIVAALLVTGLWVTSASSDVIHLKNGNRLVGKIVREEGEEAVVKVSFGEVRVLKENIVRVEVEPTPSPTPTPPPKPEAPETESGAPAQTQSPSPSATVSPCPSPEPIAPPAEKLAVKPFDEWYAAWHPVSQEDARGYANNSLGVGKDGMITLKEELVLLGPDRKPRVHSTYKVIVGPDFVPVSFAVSQRERAFLREVEGVVSTGYVNANQTVIGKKEEKQVAFPKGALVGHLPIMKFLQTASLSVGSEEFYRSFDFLQLAPIGVRIKVVGRETVNVSGTSYQTVVLDVAVERRGALIENYKLWAVPRSARHPSGRIVKRQELPDGYVYLLSSEKEAREPIEYWLKTYEALLKWMSERSGEAAGEEAPQED